MSADERIQRPHGKVSMPSKEQRVLPHRAGLHVHLNALLQAAALCLLAGTPALCLATEPLVSPVHIGEHHGVIYPEKCCSMDLPRTEKLREMRLAQSCTAIGGPVGEFKIADRKVWLTSLRTCDGDIPLHDVYPEMSEPVVATWLDGNFAAKLGYQCTINGYQRIYQHSVRMVVEKGIVTEFQLEAGDDEGCDAR